MKKFEKIAWVTALLVVTGSVSAWAAPKVTICHIPPGNPGNAHTITVGEPAVPAHLAHGDTLGACDTTQPNQPPEADAGEDQCLLLGDTATLDGSGSSDPDGDPITYSWGIDEAPEGTTVGLTGADTVAPSFTPDRLGRYRIGLEVSDGELTDDDEVSVWVTMQPSLDAESYTVRVLQSVEVTVTLHTVAPQDVVVAITLDDAHVTASETPLGPAIEEVTVPAGSDHASFWLNGVAAGEASLTVTVGDEACFRTAQATVVVEPPEIEDVANALHLDMSELGGDLDRLLQIASESDPNFIDSDLWKAIVNAFGELDNAIGDALDTLLPPH